MESDGTTTGVGEQDSRGKLSPVLGYDSTQVTSLSPPGDASCASIADGTVYGA